MSENSTPNLTSAMMQIDIQQQKSVAMMRGSSDAFLNSNGFFVCFNTNRIGTRCGKIFANNKIANCNEKKAQEFESNNY